MKIIFSVLWIFNLRLQVHGCLQHKHVMVIIGRKVGRKWIAPIIKIISENIFLRKKCHQKLNRMKKSRFFYQKMYNFDHLSLLFVPYNRLELLPYIPIKSAMLRQRSPTFVYFTAFKKSINMYLNISATNANYNIKRKFTYLRIINGFSPKSYICTSCNKKVISSQSIFFIRYNLLLIIKQSCIFIFSI